jgi:hypothetical protein
LRTARGWHVPLSVFRGRRRPGKKWLQSDTLLAAALQMHEDSICPDCGQYRDETFDPANDGDNPYRTASYVVSEPLRDHACTAMARARKGIADAEMVWPEGLRMGVSKVPISRGEPSQRPT